MMEVIEGGVVGLIRERIEDIVRRYGLLRVLVAAAAVLLAILLARRVLRVVGRAATVVIVVVGGWLLISWLFLPVPMISSNGPVVRNGVAAVVACGEKRGAWGLEAVKVAPEPRTGTWGTQRRGECTIYYHHPPDTSQRLNRQLRARAH
jgi:hypothetical protein